MTIKELWLVIPSNLSSLLQETHNWKSSLFGPLKLSHKYLLTYQFYKNNILQEKIIEINTIQSNDIKETIVDTISIILKLKIKTCLSSLV